MSGELTARLLASTGRRSARLVAPMPEGNAELTSALLAATGRAPAAARSDTETTIEQGLDGEERKPALSGYHNLAPVEPLTMGERVRVVIAQRRGEGQWIADGVMTGRAY